MSVKQGRPPKDPDYNNFWKEYGKETINKTLEGLDERAKNMITTCAGLIVVNFGLLLAFNVENLVVKVTPQLFLVISTAMFALSYFPIPREFSFDSPKTIEKTYRFWLRWRKIWHLAGFVFFVAGLLAIAYVSLMGQIPAKSS